MDKDKKQACFVLYSHPMNLMMYIGNDLIESIPLELERISSPGYVGNFKRKLKMKYSELIQQYSEKPEFLVIDPAPRAQYIAMSQNTKQA